MMVRWRWLASVSLVALILVCLTWEGWLAPLRPGGSLLVLKAAPLLLPLKGILHGRRYTYQWTSMFILLYLMEGAVRAWADVGLSAGLAVVELILALSLFVACLFFARLTAPSRQHEQL